VVSSTLNISNKGRCIYGANLPVLTSDKQIIRRKIVGTEENKAIVKKAIEANEKNDWSLADEYYASDFVFHVMTENPPRDLTLEQLKTLENTPPTLSDLEATIEDMIAEGDKVSVRRTVSGKHTGIGFHVEPTGKSVNMVQFIVCRFQDGKIADMWILVNMASVLQQLGIIPPAEELGK
jgi:predicted ester cyclase